MLHGPDFSKSGNLRGAWGSLLALLMQPLPTLVDDCEHGMNFSQMRRTIDGGRPQLGNRRIRGQGNRCDKYPEISYGERFAGIVAQPDHKSSVFGVLLS
jgi:hypothetical protein